MTSMTPHIAPLKALASLRFAAFALAGVGAFIRRHAASVSPPDEDLGLPDSLTRHRRVLADAGMTSWERRLDACASVGEAFRHVLEPCLPEDRPQVDAALGAVWMAGVDAFDVTFRRAGAGGRTLWQRETGRVYRDAEGRPVCITGLSIDVTAEREAQSLLCRRRSEAEAASAAKTEFLASMSHEIRTPLAAILGFCEVLGDADLAARDREETVRIIRRNGELLGQIVSDVLDLSKIEAGRLEVERLRFDVCDLVRDVCLSLEPRAKAKGLELTFRFAEPLPREVVTDPTRLKQILMNVVGNAVKFTEQGSVSVTVERDARDLVFTVQDTGIGFTPEQRARMFQDYVQAEPGTTRKYGGSGLGLKLARQLARRLGGDVELAASAPGQGSTFRITLAAG